MNFTLPKSRFLPALTDCRAWLCGLVLFGLAFSSLQAQPDPNYAPELREPVFNVRDFGAQGDDVADDTAAIRAAMEACRQAGGGTVYLPAGTYRVAPPVKGESTFTITFGNLTIEGDGHEQTILNFQAWGMQDPESLMTHRGSGFVINNRGPVIDGVTFRGFRATGNAAPTPKAGAWWGDDALDGWDIHHKGLGVWGRVNNIVIEDSEWDNWRGEVLYSGGALELGRFTIRRCLVYNSNASAISMGGDVLVEDTEVYDVHNGTECFSMGGHHQLVVRNCVIEPNRNFGPDMKIGKFGVVYLGYMESALVVENCLIGETTQGGVFLSEFAHNVRIANNVFQDTIGIYGIFLNMYEDLTPNTHLQRGMNNIDILNNRFEARTKRVADAILFFTGDCENWRIIGNEVASYDGNSYGNFIKFAGVRGYCEYRDNVIHDAQPFAANYIGPRPLSVNNTVTGSSARGTRYANYRGADDPSPIVTRPAWGRLYVSDLADGVTNRELIIDPESLTDFPVGFTLEIRRSGNRCREEGVEIRPDPRWNNLERGYLVYRDDLLTLRMGESGLFELVSFEPGPEDLRILTDDKPDYRRNLQEISAYGRPQVSLEPRVRHTFNTFSGIAVGDTVTIHYNELTTIAHVPGELELSGGTDFVATACGTLQATREGDVLRLHDPSNPDSGDSGADGSDTGGDTGGEDPLPGNTPPVVTAAAYATDRGIPVEFTLPASDADGDALSFAVTGLPQGGTLDLERLPVVVYHPAADFIGADQISFTVSDGAASASGSVTLEVQPPLASLDTDGDGAPDLQELLFGTDPDDAVSTFRLRVERGKGTVMLHLPAIAHPQLRAVVESTFDLSQWQEEAILDAQSVVPQSLGHHCLEFACDDTGAMRFFRVRSLLVE